MKVARFINGETDWRKKIPRLKSVSLSSCSIDKVKGLLGGVKVGYLYSYGLTPSLGLTPNHICELLELRLGFPVVRMPTLSTLQGSLFAEPDPVFVVKTEGNGSLVFLKLTVEVYK